MDASLTDVQSREEQSLRALVHGVADVAALLGPEGEVLAANQAAAEFYDVAREDMTGRSIFELPTSGSLPRRKDRLDAAVATGRIQRFRDELPSGVVLAVTLVPWRDAVGRVRQVAFFAHDVTGVRQRAAARVASASERSEALEQANARLRQEIKRREWVERELRRSKDRYRLIVENVGSIIAILNLEGTLLFVNGTALEWTGLESQADLVGKTLWDVLDKTSADRHMANVRDVILFQKEISEEGYVEALGREGWFDVRVLPFGRHHEAGQLAVAIAVDVTEHRRLEEALISIAERERRLMGMTVHDDLGQHLTGMRLLCDALSKKLGRRGAEEAGLAAELAKYSLA